MLASEVDCRTSCQRIEQIYNLEGMLLFSGCLPQLAAALLSVSIDPTDAVNVRTGDNNDRRRHLLKSGQSPHPAGQH